MSTAPRNGHRMPRKRPCASCPYRRDVPSGIWDASEYEILEKYDGSIGEQAESGAMHVFGCHQADGSLCAGWAGHRDPLDLLAVRLGISNGTVDADIADYSTDVPLFESGEEAAAHGMKDYETPGLRAQNAMRKLRASVPGLSS